LYFLTVACQVLHKLVSVLSQQQPSSLHSAAEPFALALNTLLSTTLRLHADQCENSSSFDALPPNTSSWASRAVSGVLRQLQGSGLLLLLPDLLTSSAQQLWELQGWTDQQLAAALADPDYDQSLQHSVSSSSFLHRQHSHVQQLLEATMWLCKLADARSDFHGMQAPLAGPTLQLALLVMQHVSRCLDLLSAHMQPPPPPPPQQQQQQQYQQRPHEWLLWDLLPSARCAAERCIS
jgi:hypothetical protein